MKPPNKNPDPMLEIRVAINLHGGLTMPTKEFVYPGWKSSILCQNMPFDDWWEYQMDLFREGINIELGVYQGDSLVGIAILTETMDAHVGNHMTLFFQYMQPEYRKNRHLWRQVIRSAAAATKELGFNYLSWTHMKNQHRFLVIYKKV